MVVCGMMLGVDELAAMPEVARLLGVSRQRVYQLIEAGGFPEPVAVLSVGRIWRRSDVVAWAASAGRLTD